METIGNIIWFLFGGFIGGTIWLLSGLIYCMTIIGIPIGKQCFMLAGVSFWPFGKEIEYGGDGLSFLANVIWIAAPGLELAIGYLVIGCLCCITIIGIPFGKQCFKLAKLSLMPFGASVW